MRELPRLADLMRDRGFWQTIANRMYWEERTRKMERPYKLWMCEHSHLHSYTELMLCVSGEHFYGIDGNAVAFSPGGLALIPKQVSHDSWYSEHHDPCVDFWMHLLPHGHVGVNFVEHRPGEALVSTSLAIKNAELAADLQRACLLLETEDLPSLKTRAFLFYLLQLILEKLAAGEMHPAAPDDNVIVKNIKEYISRNLADRLDLAELARVAGYSPFHFHRVFTRSEKITPRNFIETSRVNQACKLLEGGQSITSTAFDVGFSTCSQFDRVFKKHMKISPSSWIKQRTG